MDHNRVRELAIQQLVAQRDRIDAEVLDHAPAPPSAGALLDAGALSPEGGRR